MVQCNRCLKSDPFLRLNAHGICYQCALDDESDTRKLVRRIIRIGPQYLGTPTGDTVRKDYYVYAWRIKDTGEIFYVGMGRGRRAYNIHERAYEAEKIRKSFDTEVIFLKEGLTEEGALQVEVDEVSRLLNETTHMLTNRIVPLRCPGDYYGRAQSAPPYQFEETPVFYATEIDEHYHGMQHRTFDEVKGDALQSVYFIEKTIGVDISEAVYRDDYEKYLSYVTSRLQQSGRRIMKTKFAKSVTAWIYGGDDFVVNYDIDQRLARERIRRQIPAYHLLDVWRYFNRNQPSNWLGLSI